MTEFVQAQQDDRPPIDPPGPPLTFIPLSKLIGADSAVNPFWTPSTQNNPDANFGLMVPAERMIQHNELWATAFTSKGAFIAWVAPRNAFRTPWKHVSTKGKNEPLPPRLSKRLDELRKIYRFKQIATAAAQICQIFGRALVYKQQNPDPRTRSKRPWTLRAVPIQEPYIFYNDDGTIDHYEPIVAQGKGYVQLYVAPEDGVLFINEIDPIGNGYQGIPALISPYYPIRWGMNIMESWAKTVATRGLGLLDITVENAKNQADLEKWANRFGNLAEYQVPVHDDRVKMTAVPGITAGFNLDETISRYTKEISSGTGFPAMRMEGVQTGAVTGSETDQDNMAENYATLQETHEPSIIALYYLVDPTLPPDSFELDWEIEIKMDKGRQAQVFATNANSITLIEDLITVNQALEKLDLPTLEGPEGEMILADYLSEKHIERAKREQEIFPSQQNNENLQEEEQDDNEPEDEMEDQNNENKNKNSAAEEKKTAAQDSAKTAIAAKLLAAGDSIREVNITLSKLFGSGLKTQTLVELRKGVEN